MVRTRENPDTYKQILVAIDGSPHAEHALHHGIGLAGSLSATLRIVHVVDTGWLGLGMELAIDTARAMQAQRDAGERLLDAARAAALAAGLKVEFRLEETGAPTDHVSSVIAKAAAEWPADLVVLGTHGRRGIERLLPGSVAEGIARLAPVPVLLVPSR